ncbi:MAG: T9SS type A sorting domain-containing protein [Bacteroidales bacterium]|nr:T9SS type A sorting domain-containing protein [Bacteroidales bacterium]
MKQVYLFLIATFVVIAGYSQHRTLVPEKLRKEAYPYNPAQLEVMHSGQFSAPWLKQSNTFVEEEVIGQTRYDNQSNASIPKKVVYFDDGTIGATWTRSMEEGSFFADRGTGYNYFNGEEWGEWPQSRVEDIKVHRPTYAPFGENGELIVSHAGESGLYLASRENKGMGSWDFDNYPGPPGHEYILWNRVVTSGIDHTNIHLLAMTLPTSHGGTTYAGLDGALLYSLSTDGGNNWEWENDILDDMSADEFVGFAGDTYAFAEPRGETVAFVFGDPWTGLFLMKSTDGGETFDQTVIWEHPYPMWQLGTPADTFYCADGSHSAIIDVDGMVHVAFGINRVSADANATYWYPWEDGIAYWTEDMPAFSDNLNALNPNGHPDSELEENYNLIGWSQDIDNNGQLEFMDDLGLYFIGLSSMPQLVYREDGILVLVFSSVTENYSNGQQNYRHLWARPAMNNGAYWGQFEHLTSDLVHIFDECVYPACASSMDNNVVYLNYQYDTEPGTAVWGAQHNYVDNSIGFISFPMVYDNIKENSTEKGFDVSQNYPNPADEETTVRILLSERSTYRLGISTVSGRQVYTSGNISGNKGTHLMKLSTAGLSEGIYMYSVTVNGNSTTKKMVVRRR